ncbi:MAG: hypothetical protein KBC00_01350 [Candidatus Levybacteria bacterium]|nr:hypothetical protein [Candidatus Levybacteria bacterium]MBP9814982.1 hypothetical protein [Candidatus Levybacteria bacterium]
MPSAEFLSQQPPFIGLTKIPFPHDGSNLEKNNARKREQLKSTWGIAVKDFNALASSSIGEKIWEQLNWESEYIQTTLTDVGQLVMSYDQDKIRKVRSALGVGEYLSNTNLWKLTRQEVLQLMTGLIANKIVNNNFYRKNTIHSGNIK